MYMSLNFNLREILKSPNFKLREMRYLYKYKHLNTFMYSYWYSESLPDLMFHIQQHQSENWKNTNISSQSFFIQMSTWIRKFLYESCNHIHVKTDFSFSFKFTHNYELFIYDVQDLTHLATVLNPDSSVLCSLFTWVTCIMCVFNIINIVCMIKDTWTIT